MLFRTLTLKNFRSHVDSTLSMEPLTVVRGPNASGKSSIEQAIQIALCGRTDSTTADGKGSASLIRGGQTKALISLLVEQPDGDTRLVQCKLADSRKAVLVTKPGDESYGGGEDWKHWLAQHRSVISCLTNNRFFVDLPRSEQADVLASIILPETLTWPEWVTQAVPSSGYSVNWTMKPFDVIAAGYAGAYQRRTEVARDLKNFHHPEGDTSAAATLEEAVKRVHALRDELDQARKRNHDAESAQAQRVQSLKAAEQRLADARVRLSREQQEIPGIEAGILSAARVKDHEKVAKNAAKVQASDAEIARLEAEVAAAQHSLKAINALSTQPSCPTCGAAITDEAVAAIAKPILDRRAELDRTLATERTARKQLGNPAESKAALATHAKALTGMERAKARIAEEQAVIADAEAKIAEITGALHLARHADNTADSLAATIKQLTASLDEASLAVQRARAARELLAQQESARTRYQELQAQHQRLEKLIDYFGPKGVKAELLDQTIGAFTAAMNVTLDGWGYACTLSFEPYEFALAYRMEGGQAFSVAIEHLSKSERYRFSVAFQVALANLTGFGFVIVDEADILDGDGRAALFNALYGGALDQAIVLSTDEREEVPCVDGAVFYRLDDVAAEGMLPATRVRKLEPAAVAAA